MRNILPIDRISSCLEAGGLAPLHLSNIPGLGLFKGHRGAKWWRAKERPFLRKRARERIASGKKQALLNPSTRITFDVDPKNGGDLRDWIDRYGEPNQYTPNGGGHWDFTLPEGFPRVQQITDRSDSPFGSGVDTCPGGVGGRPTFTGPGYRVVHLDCPPLPKELADGLLEWNRRSSGGGSPGSGPAPEEGNKSGNTGEKLSPTGGSVHGRCRAFFREAARKHSSREAFESDCREFLDRSGFYAGRRERIWRFVSLSWAARSDPDRPRTREDWQRERSRRGGIASTNRGAAWREHRRGLRKRQAFFSRCAEAGVSRNSCSVSEIVRATKTPWSSADRYLKEGDPAAPNPRIQLDWVETHCPSLVPGCPVASVHRSGELLVPLSGCLERLPLPPRPRSGDLSAPTDRRESPGPGCENPV